MAVTLPAPTVATVQPKSPHLADKEVQPFLQDDFDPADYLNTRLPALTTSSKASQNATSARSVPLPELSSQLQSLLVQLNAQTSRLSNALTQLTDEILRSGGRLAYEVEVLKGETFDMSDSLESGLKRDIDVFTSKSQQDTNEGADEVQDASQPEPEYLTQLKTLTAVRSRLDSVIKVFGEAMQWPLAPSELSLASSLISVSAPDSSDDSRSREEKGKAYVETIRREISDMIGTGNDPAGLEAAAAKIDQLRQLAELWKGTAEERARSKLVDNLQKPMEEKQKALEQQQGARRSTATPTRGMDYRYGTDPSTAPVEGGYGFLQNLRNFKNDMYLE